MDNIFYKPCVYAHEGGDSKDMKGGNMSNKLRILSSKKSQDERISAEIQRLNSILKNMHESKRAAASELIKNIAFMSVTLEDLQELIKTQGPIVQFEQGSQKMLVENPAQKSYNTMVARFTTATSNLFALMPKDLPDIIPMSSEAKEEKPRDKLAEFQEKYSK